MPVTLKMQCVSEAKQICMVFGMETALGQFSIVLLVGLLQVPQIDDADHCAVSL